MNRHSCTLHHLPTFAVLLADVHVRLWTAGAGEVLGVPFDGLFAAVGDVAQEDRFGEWTGVIEVAKCGRPLFAGFDPLGVVTD